MVVEQEHKFQLHLEIPLHSMILLISGILLVVVVVALDLFPQDPVDPVVVVLDHLLHRLTEDPMEKQTLVEVEVEQQHQVQVAQVVPAS